ncbi:hypothetical protein V2G26_011586 [Clonostachys chloroleuca]
MGCFHSKTRNRPEDSALAPRLSEPNYQQAAASNETSGQTHAAGATDFAMRQDVAPPPVSQDIGVAVAPPPENRKAPSERSISPTSNAGGASVLPQVYPETAPHDFARS